MEPTRTKIVRDVTGINGVKLRVCNACYHALRRAGLLQPRKYTKPKPRESQTGPRPSG